MPSLKRKKLSYTSTTRGLLKPVRTAPRDQTIYPVVSDFRLLDFVFTLGILVAIIVCSNKSISFSFLSQPCLTHQVRGGAAAVACFVEPRIT
ncbi:hypothetical protein RSOLAG1IB_10401 [Rhizoctonia solani AG-1 IB]|uniref:Uncharacterized protein n=1 Tax=Thanatephorus cucumeris (strain AG1-IB / isolate 7/3/14) TaxID=1108050 RepID=A0A0B7G1I2_THACB|nr:hypothetical protein RSOLAG1IB_10401 [Rhizoctonia solani AG-1 IB]